MEYSKIARELIDMKNVDQKIRMSLKPGMPFPKELAETDLKHTARMKEIIEEIGWPTNSKVGKEAAGCAWLLVQHADHDPDFQSECLELMQQYPENEVHPINVAYLEDRVRLNTGQKQMYGTQLERGPDGTWQPKPLEDPDHVDTRRRAIGLEPLEDYINRFAELYN